MTKKEKKKKVEVWECLIAIDELCSDSTNSNTDVLAIIREELLEREEK